MLLKKQDGSSVFKRAASAAGHAGLTLLLRAGRITRVLPREKGFYKLRKLYQRILPKGFMVRTRLDGDLLFDVDLKDNLGLYLWHYPHLYEKAEIEAFCSFIRRPRCGSELRSIHSAGSETGRPGVCH
jgi:hypothetical protein